MNTFNRSTRFIGELIDLGPLYAIANNRIHSQTPIYPAENWQFWTKPKANWLESLLYAYPSEPARKRYFDTILSQAHATGIEAHYDVSND
ncbi:MAG: class I SAM-dependent methyltransferase, partial [Cyanobacteria bacterium J06631_9]